MGTKVVDFELVIGQDFSHPDTAVQPDGSTPFVWTGWSQGVASGAMRHRNNGATASIELIQGASGTYTIKTPGTAMSAMIVGVADYDVFTVNGDAVECLQRGTIRFIDRVTPL